jgi:hypothetical protein
MRRLYFSYLLLIVICGGVSGCSDHPVTTSPSEPDDRIIAFSSDSGASRGSSIFVMHADGATRLGSRTAAALLTRFQRGHTTGR